MYGGGVSMETDTVTLREIADDLGVSIEWHC
jgi:hypothetical protein